MEVLTGSRTLSHTVFKVKVERTATSDSANQDMGLFTHQRACGIPDSPIVSPAMLCNIFPFHIVFDTSLVIRQCGDKIVKNEILQGPVFLDDLFSLAEPRMPLTFNHILRFCNASYLLDSKLNIPGKESRLTLKGEFVF